MDPYEPTRLLCPWDSPDKNTRVGCHSLLEGIQAQGSNPGLLHRKQILYHLSHRGAPTTATVKPATVVTTRDTPITVQTVPPLRAQILGQTSGIPSQLYYV